MKRFRELSYAEKANLMNHHEDGGAIQFSYDGENWGDIEDPSWTPTVYYRVKKSDKNRLQTYQFLKEEVEAGNRVIGSDVAKAFEWHLGLFYDFFYAFDGDMGGAQRMYENYCPDTTWYKNTVYDFDKTQHEFIIDSYDTRGEGVHEVASTAWLLAVLDYLICVEEAK